MSAEEILAARRLLLGPSLSVHYQRPLHITRGSMQYLYDDAGEEYLDAVNNVAHVGHEHPRVVEALRRQAGILNTNTRYLHPGLVEYAERLAATFPDPLEVCWFVNSGSEANELALRMARAHTGRRDVIVLEGAYHGNTSSLIEMSPYKYRGPGGDGPGDWVHEAPLPDPYRRGGEAPRGRDSGEKGRRRDRGADVERGDPGGQEGGGNRGPGAEASDPGAGFARGLEAVLQAAAARHRPIAAFFVEPLPGCAGQIVPPPGYLSEAFRRVRDAGGICVADEVQTGFGRAGSRFWAFEAVEAGGRRSAEAGPGPATTSGTEAPLHPDAVPDIVTLGKPMGNGHPVGAVVTTREVADSFATGMEYFNTFGGNPVSMAVASAVLDVIREEGLQAHAAEVGAELLAGLKELMDRHEVIGDVRGTGLYLGVELVLDRTEKLPAPDEAARAAEALRDRRILIGTDGIHGNVLKIKPPLPFDAHDGGRLVEALDQVLGEAR